MDKSYKDKYYDLEDKHWWNVSRREIIIKLLSPLSKKETKVLDIGCSSGALIEQIISYVHSVLVPFAILLMHLNLNVCVPARLMLL